MDSAGTTYLHKPEKLKYILAPILATTAGEQAQFYQIFDSYFEEIKPPLEIVQNPKIQWWERVPKWIWTALPILLFLTGLSYGIFKIFEPKPEPLKAFFQHQPTVKIGDTITFKNLSENADSLCKFSWEVFDDKENVLEHAENQLVDCQMVMDTFENSADKMVRLIANHQHLNQLDTFVSTFQIHCSDPPEIQLSESNPTGNLTIGESYEFAVDNQEKDLEFEWNLGAEKTQKGRKISTKFDQSGTSKITVKATRKNRKAYCFTTINIPVAIDQDKAFLDYKPLKADKITPTAHFAHGSWLLWALTGLGMMYYLMKWLRRKAPEIEAEDNPIIASETPDRGPYYIPFQSRNNLVKIDRSLFKFADVLRLRQEGLRQRIDVANTIKTTVESGGFPNLSTSTTTRPTEYLFLIDELARESHQTKLFLYLTDFLRDRDVLVEQFFYKDDFSRFWNKQNKEGISLEILQRMYSTYRMVVLGNGHDLLDPFAKEKPVLKKATARLLKGWKNRFLLSPLPVISWNYREKVLFEHFDIFPADLDGLQIAMRSFEIGKDEEEHPNFAIWQSQFKENRQETDVNYRKWRRVRDFEDYLKKHPKVFLWLSALAVYPRPNWSLTIAIGKALATFGVEVTYDNLLLLSRIPFLQNGELSPKLRMELLKKLPADVEAAARKAVKEELEAVEDLVKNSHANVEHQSNLAIQNFVLAPTDGGNQQFLKELLAADLLNRKQLAELNLGLQRHFEKKEAANKESQSFTKKVMPAKVEAPDLATFLAENKEEQPKPPRPFFTPDFAKGVAFGLLFLIGLLLFWTLNNTDRLYELAYGEKPTAAFKTAEDMRDGWLVKEDILVDSAVIYNNIGREYQARRKMSRFEDPDGRDAPQYISFEDAEQSFKNALRVRKDYPLATHNLAKLYYNEGARKYHQVIRDSVATDSLDKAFLLFYKATDVLLDSLLADGYHGMGLTDYYSNDFLKADSTLQFIEEQTDSVFFDTLTTYPHLRSLMTARKAEVFTQKEQDAQRVLDSLALVRRQAIREQERLKKEQELAAEKEPETKQPTLDNQLPNYDKARFFAIDGKYGLWDDKERVILEPTYDRIGDFGGIFTDLAEVELNNKVGLINKKGEVVVPLDYSRITSIYYQKERLETVAIVEKDYLQGVVDNKGKVLIEPKYDRIRMASQYSFLVQQGKEVLGVFFDEKGIEEEFYGDAKYVIRLGAFKNSADFDRNYVIDIGVISTFQMLDSMVVYLDGYNSRKEAEVSLSKAKERGFETAYLITNNNLASDDEKKTTSRYLWCLNNDHGKLQAGKRSPIFDDGVTQFFEYEFNRDIVERVMVQLDELGIAYYDVVPDYNEVGSFLKGRVNRANSFKSELPKLFVTVSANAGSTEADGWGATTGIETWYNRDSQQGKKLASIFQQKMVDKLGWENRYLKSTKIVDLYTLRETQMPSILTECGFYTNKEQVKELMKDEIRQKIADAYVEAILEVEKNGL